MIPRALAALALALAGCTSIDESPFPDVPDAAPPIDAVPLGPTLSSLWPNVLAPRCAIPCHSGGPLAAAGGLDLGADAVTARARLVDQASTSARCAGMALVRVVPGDPEASLLFAKVAAKTEATAVCGDPMPQGSARPALSTEEVEAIRQWIEDGAAGE